ncbi:hypothetical protein QYE76_045708 [Lolium multiflorum]|uniref:Transposase (putative) gypsy type domain-containing protein n=1 Tax=Lolium multiflorum TaxID=4521 RepID=A0AAD8TKU5_LOLMU|nr:hypothetical protein QYE76_045708 [Lolium multiflorum]
MPPRGRLIKHAAPGTDAAMEDVEMSGWERSKLTNQDKRGLKNLGLLKKKDSLIFPGDESAPNPPIGYRATFIDHLIRGLSTPVHEFLRGLLFVYGIQLHQLTPNSILHISLFITLCECFLGTHPHWGMWKRIFYLRRNNSCNIVYNVGGVCICVRPGVDYFDVKFPNSVQGWRKRWLYIKDESVGNQEYDIAPFDGAAKIIRCRSWDTEASDEEKAATDALMKRIHQLQNTHGEELSGIQITAYFHRIRVQPLQACENPLWMYAGEEDVDHISKDLVVKDLEKLIRCFSSLSKKDEVPTSCRVEPYSGSHALPEVKPTSPDFSSSPNEPLSNDAQSESEVAASNKSAASSEKGSGSEPSASGRSTFPPSAVSPRSKRKRGDFEDSGTSKPAGSPAEETSPEEEDAFDPYEGTALSEKGKEEGPTNLGIAPTSTSNTLVISEEHRVVAESSPPPQQIVETSTPPSSPRAPSPKRTKTGAGDEQTLILGSSSTPMLNDPLMDQFIRLCSQSIGFRNEVDTLKGRNDEGFKLLAAKDDRLLDALSILEFGQNVDWAKAGDSGKINKEKWKALVKDAKPHSKKIIAFFTPKPAGSTSTAKTEVREYLEFWTKTLAMVYNAMFPRNLQPKTLPDLMDKFKSVRRIHGFVKAQLMAGARFSMIMLQICYPKLDMSNVVDLCHAKLRKRRRNVDKINDVVTPVAEKMIEDLLRMDTAFFKEHHYADTMGASAEDERINIDDLIKDD